MIFHVESVFLKLPFPGLTFGSSLPTSATCFYLGHLIYFGKPQKSLMMKTMKSLDAPCTWILDPRDNLSATTHRVEKPRNHT